MLYRNKAQWVRAAVAGRKVLDLGCVCHNLDNTQGPDWLHGIVKAHAREVVGVDYLEDEVDALRRCGYNVVCANVETMDLDETFEVIVAGDLIEHLSNFGLFMETLVRHLAPGGVVLLSTPNPVNLLRMVGVLLRGGAGANSEHTCWFTAQVLQQLAARYGFVVSDVAYVDDSYQYYRFGRWWPFLGMNYLLCRVRHAFSETICVTLEMRTAGDMGKDIREQALGTQHIVYENGRRAAQS